VNGPGTFIFARDDASAPRQPSLYQVTSTYVVEAQQAAAGEQTMFTAITAAIAIAVLWYVGKMK
jgi:hypothetical protein